MYKIKFGLLVIALLLLYAPLNAQFRLSGEFRPRTEFSHGYKSPATKNQDWSVATAQRTRLNALFSAKGINTKLVLQDAYLKYSSSKNKFGWNATLHYFLSAGRINADSGRYLGTELDLSVSWQVQTAASISTGWSTMFAGKNLELLKGGDHTAGNHWAYIMLSVTPTFIK